MFINFRDENSFNRPLELNGVRIEQKLKLNEHMKSLTSEQLTKVYMLNILVD